MCLELNLVLCKRSRGMTQGRGSTLPKDLCAAAVLQEGQRAPAPMPYSPALLLGSHHHPRDSQIFTPGVYKQAQISFQFNHLYFCFRSQCLTSKSATPAGCLLIEGCAECNLTDEDSCILFISSMSCVGPFVNLVSICRKGRDEFWHVWGQARSLFKETSKQK